MAGERWEGVGAGYREGCQVRQVGGGGGRV